MNDEILGNGLIFLPKKKDKKTNYFCPFCGVNSYTENKINECKHLIHINDPNHDLVYFREDIYKKLGLKNKDNRKIPWEYFWNNIMIKDQFFWFQEDDEDEGIVISYEYK